MPFLEQMLHGELCGCAPISPTFLGSCDECKALQILLGAWAVDEDFWWLLKWSLLIWSRWAALWFIWQTPEGSGYESRI